MDLNNKLWYVFDERFKTLLIKMIMVSDLKNCINNFLVRYFFWMRYMLIIKNTIKANTIGNRPPSKQIILNAVSYTHLTLPTT